MTRLGWGPTWCASIAIAVAAACAVVSACVGDDPANSAPNATDASVDDADAAAPDTSTPIDAAPPPDEGAPPIDAGADAPCNPDAPFGAPALVAGINGSSDDTVGRLSWDELTIYFSSKRSGTVGIWAATRQAISDDFANVAALTTLNSGTADAFPMVAKNDVTIYFTSTRKGSDDLYAATRTNGGNPFIKPFVNVAPLASLNTGAAEQAPFLSADATELFFATTQPSANPMRIFRALGPAFNTSAPVTELDTTGANYFPTLSADGRTIYFASDRATSTGGLDIWYAKRSGPGATFDPPISASTINTQLNSTADESPSWVSPDDCRLYFTSKRPGLGGADIYVAERPK